MPTRIHLDFETYSEVELKLVGVYNYAKHPSTRLRCGTYQIEQDGVLQQPVDWRDENVPFELQWYAMDDSVTFAAHNARFERLLWHWRCSRALGIPDIANERWLCTAAKAAQFSLPRGLKECGEALNITNKKIETGKRVMLKMAKPKKLTRKDLRLWHDSEEDYEELIEYNIGDVLAEQEIDHIVPDLRARETAIYQSDLRMNDRGVRVDVEYAQKAIQLAEECRLRLDQQMRMITNGRVLSTQATDAIKQFCADQGFPIASIAKDKLVTILEQADMLGLPHTVKQVLELRQKGAKSTAAKYVRALQLADKDDSRMRGLLLYYGATTGRAAGMDFQPQNLTKATVKASPEQIREVIMSGKMERVAELGDPMAVIASGIRQTMIADEGKEFIVVDYAGIEPRVLAWLAGYEKGLQKFRNGDDVYIPMGAKIFDKPESEIKKGSFERDVGKLAILGLGYFMGADKFRISCATKGVELSPELAAKAVKAYRQEHHLGMALGNAIEAAAIMAVQRPNQLIKVNPNRDLLRFIFIPDKKLPILYFIMPAGGFIAYPFPKVVIGKKFGNQVLSFMGKHKKALYPEETYSGKLLENAVQRIARDLLCNAIDRSEEAGFNPILQVHDELITEPEKDRFTVKQLEDLMCELPEWAKQFGGIPVAAEGWKGQFYKK